MSYNVTTRDGYELKNIPDNIPPDSPQILAELNRLREEDRLETLREKQKQEERQVNIGAVSRSSGSKEEDNILTTIGKGFGTGLAGIYETAALGAITPLEEETELKARKYIQESLDFDALKGADEDSITFQLASGLGSIAGFIPAALLGPAALPAAGALAVGAGAGEASERARASGATEEERNIAALKGAAVGLTEILPFGRFAKALEIPGIQKILGKLEPKSVEGIKSRIKNAAGTGALEGAQEGAAAILQNLVEQGYNPEKELFDAGVIDEATIGGGAGAIFQGIVDLLLGRKIGARKITGTEGTTDTDEVAALDDEEITDEDRAAALEVSEEPAERLDATKTDTTKEDLSAVSTEDLLIRAEEGGDFSQALIDELLRRKAGLEESEVLAGIEEQERKKQKAVDDTVEESKKILSMSDLAIMLEEGNPVALIEQTIDNASISKEEKQKLREGLINDLIKPREAADARVNETGVGTGVSDDTSGQTGEGVDTVTRTDDARVDSDGEGVGTTDAGKTGEQGALTGKFTSFSTETGNALKAALGMRPATDIDPRDARKAVTKAGFSEQEAKLADEELENIQKSFEANIDRDETFIDENGEEQVRRGTGKIIYSYTIPKDYSKNDRGANLVAEEDVQIINDLLATGGNVDDKNARRAYNYFNKFARPEDALYSLAFEIADDTPSFQNIKKTEIQEPKDAILQKVEQNLFTGTGGAQFLTKEGKPRTKEQLAKQNVAGTLDWINSTLDYNKGTQKQIFNYVTQIEKQKARQQKIEEIYSQLTPADKRKTLEQQDRDQERRRTDLESKRAQEVLEARGITGVQVTTDTGKKGKKGKKGEGRKKGSEFKKAAEQLVKIAGERKLQANVKEDVATTLVEEERAKEQSDPDTYAAENDKRKSKEEDKRYRRDQNDLAEAAAQKFSKKTEQQILRIDQAIYEARGGVITEIPYMGKPLERRLLPIEFINQLDGFLSKAATKLLNNKDLKGALIQLSKDSKQKRVKQIARVLSEVVGDTQIIFRDYGPSEVSGNTIFVSRQEPEIAVHTLLHEATHVAIDSTLNNKNHPMTKQLQKLFDEVKGELGTTYGKKNLREFIAEALSNSEFQKKLAGMNPRGEPLSALNRFFRSIVNLIRSLAGMNTRPVDSALDKVDAEIISFLSTSPDTRGVGSVPDIATQEGVRQVLKELGNVQKSFAPPTTQFRKKWSSDMVQTLRNISTKGNVILSTLQSQSLGDVAKNIGFGDLGNSVHIELQKLRASMEQSDAVIGAQVEKILEWVNKNTKNKETLGKIDDLIYSRKYGATIYQVDPTIETLQEAEAEYIKENYPELTEEQLAEMVEVWKDQRPIWKSIGKEGQNIYREMQDIYYKQFLQLERTLTGHNKDLMGEEAAKSLKKNVFNDLFNKKRLKVYFPLVREGEYKLSYTPTGLGPRGEVIRENKDNYVVEMFESKRERDARAAEVKAKGLASNGEVSTVDGALSVGNFKNAPPTSFMVTIIGELKKNNVEQEVINEVINEYIQILPETSYARSLQSRTGIEGHKQDSILALRTKAFDIGRQVQRLNSNRKLLDLEKQIQEKTEVLRVNNPDSQMVEAVAKEMLKRSTFGRTGPTGEFEKVFQMMNQTAFIFTIGFNPSSMIVNYSQLPLYVGPMLGGKFGHKKTADAMLKAKALVAASGNDMASFFEIEPETITETDINGKTVEVPTGNFKYKFREDFGKIENKVKDKYKRYDVLVERASGRSYFTKSYLADALNMGEYEATGADTLRKLGFKPKTKRKETKSKLFGVDTFLNAVSSFSAIMFNAGERYNRQVSLVASYDLVLDKLTNGKPEKATTAQKIEAADEAMYLTTEYNGGAVTETGARIAQQGWRRTAFMYKNYGFGMTYSMFKTSGVALGNLIAEINNAPISEEAKIERRAAMKAAFNQAGATMLAAILLSGVQALPLVGGAMLLWDLLFGEEGEPDAETLLRNYLTEEWYKGPLIAALGVDYSDRVRLNTLLWQENRYYRNQSPEEMMFAQVFGPFVNTALQKWKMVSSDLEAGNTTRAFESSLPTGLANAWKYLYRIADEEGFRTRKGDIIYDDITSGDTLWGILGFAPMEYTAIQEAKAAKKKVASAVVKQRTKLYDRYYLARRMGTFSDTLEVLANIREFNAKYPSAAIPPTELVRSYKTNIASSFEKSKHNGVTISPLMARVLDQEMNRHSDKFYDFLD